MTAALLFHRYPAASGALVFGDEDGGEPVVVSASPVTVQAVLPGLTAHLVACYVSGAQRPITGEVRARYQDARSHGERTRSRWQDSGRQQEARRTRWQNAAPAPTAILAGWRDVLRFGRGGMVTWYQNGLPSGIQVRGRFQEALRMTLESTETAQRALQRSAPTLHRYQDAFRGLAGQQRVRWQDALAVVVEHAMRAHDGVSLVRVWSSRYQDAVAPPPGISAIGPVKPPRPPDPCYLPHAALLFDRMASTSAALLFVCDHDLDPMLLPGLVVIPVLRRYLMLNSASLRRVDGDLPIPLTSMSLSLDVDSWTYSFSARVPGSALALVEPGAGGEPVEAEACINGVAYRVLIESLSSDRTFGRYDLAVSGRGKAAILDAPYVPTRVFNNAGAARTAQQLAREVLTFNGVPIGWDTDAGWKPEDWLVPAGAWSHQGTYISALAAIAGAAGAYLQPHRVDAALQVLMRYPAAPWTWSDVVPDIQLPADVVSREGIGWSDLPLYNRVYVRGEQQPAPMAIVTRAGTAGDVEAPMVVDPLITTVAAARQRALPVLANVGRQAAVTLRLPVLAETGVIWPGKFVRYVDRDTTHMGLVRSSSATVERSDDKLQIWQTIGVETHVTQ